LLEEDPEAILEVGSPLEETEVERRELFGTAVEVSRMLAFLSTKELDDLVSRSEGSKLKLEAIAVRL